MQRYGSSLKRSIELPTFVKEIKPPAGVILAADSGTSTIYELEGDVYALNLVDLEREGLVEYRYLLKQIESPNNVSFALTDGSTMRNSSVYIDPPFVKNENNINVNLLNELYKSIDVDENNTIALHDAHKLLSRLNARLGKMLTDDDEDKNLTTLTDNGSGRLDFDEFKFIFESQLKN